MHPRLALAIASLSLTACGMSYTLDEREGVDVVRGEFTARGIATADARTLGPLTVDGVGVTFTLDGWSAARTVGFEYVAEGDPDVAEAATDLGADREAPKLQAAVDAALVAEPATHVLIVRTWGHETYELARDQLQRYVDDWLTAHGL